MQIKHLSNFSAVPPKAGLQKEQVGLQVVAWLALHHLHHPDELDGVVNEDLGQSNYRTPSNFRNSRQNAG